MSAVENGLSASYEDYENAKTYWETFEYSDDRFPYPRKNYQYVTRLVHADGDTAESIDRATRYFDTLQLWLLQAEAYQCLVDELPQEQAAKLASEVYAVSKPLLSPALGHSDPDKNDTEPNESRTLTFENILVMLNWAAAKSADNHIMREHEQYLSEGLVADLMVRGDDSVHTEYTAERFKTGYYSLIQPEMYCARMRMSANRLTKIEKLNGYIGCTVCSESYLEFSDTGWQQVDFRNEACKQLPA